MAGSSDSGGRALASGAERMHLAPAFNEGLGIDRALPLAPQFGPTAFTVRPPSPGAGLFGEPTRWTWGSVGVDGAFPSGHNGLAALCAVALCWRTHAR